MHVIIITMTATEHPINFNFFFILHQYSANGTVNWKWRKNENGDRGCEMQCSELMHQVSFLMEYNVLHLF